MRFPKWKKIDWICEELTWNLSRNLTNIKGSSDTIIVVVGTINPAGIYLLNVNEETLEQGVKYVQS